MEDNMNDNETPIANALGGEGIALATHADADAIGAGLDDWDSAGLDDPMGPVEWNTPLTLEATDAIDSTLGDSESQNWLVRGTLKVTDGLTAAAVAIAESPYSLVDTLARPFGWDTGLKEAVRKDIAAGGGEKIANFFRKTEEENPIMYNLTQGIAEAGLASIGTNPLVGKAASKFVKWRAAKGANSVSPFIHGIADAAKVEQGTYGAKGAYEAFATSDAALGLGYRGGYATVRIAENIANDAVIFGRWGMEQDKATGEYLKNWGAIPGALAFSSGFGGIAGLWQAGSTISRARVAIFEKRYQDAREIITQHGEQVAKLAGRAAKEDGALARDFLMYEIMKPVEDARVRGQATINLRESVNKVLQGGMENVDEQYLERLMQVAYHDAADLGTAQYRTLRVAKAQDIVDPKFANDTFVWIDTRSADKVAAARMNKKEELIAEYLGKHRKIKRDSMPQAAIDEIMQQLDEAVPEYKGFNYVIRSASDTLPPDDAYIKVIRLKNTKTPMTVSAGFGRATAAMKAELESAVKGSLLEGVEKDVPELVGGLSDWSMDLLRNYGRTANRPIKSTAVFSSARRETLADPTASKALSFGELNNNVARSVAHNVGIKHDDIRKLMATLRNDSKASAEFYAEFGRMYDSAGNLGWDIRGLTPTKDGVGMLLMDTTYNRLKAEQLGFQFEDLYDEAAKAFLMPDVHTLFGGYLPSPALTRNQDVVSVLQQLFKVESDITQLREIGRLHGEPISSATSAIHFRKQAITGDKIYRVVRKSQYGDQMDHVAFPNEESARRFLEERARAGDNSWSQDIIKGGRDFGQSRGVEMETYDMLGNTSGEHARGFWQGNQTRATESILVDILQQQTASATNAARTAVASSMNNAMRQLAGTLSEEAYQEMRQFIRGVMPKNPQLQKLDDFVESCFERMFGYGRADKEALKDEDLLHAIPNKQAYSAAQALQKHGTLVNYALYAAGNVSGTINNVLSYIPQMATTGAWMRKFSSESVEEYTRRVGLEGYEELAKQGLQPRYTLGLRTMKNLGNKKWRKLVHELAEAESIKTDQAEDIAKFLDPLLDTSWWHKPVKILSAPIAYSERMSRFMSFATWFTYAQDALKMETKFASKWAARMTEESMAAYSPFVRLGATNHAVAQAAMMFKGTVTNMLMKNLDMIIDKQYTRVATANLINMYLFGAKTAPLVSDYQATHWLEDTTAANAQYELGAWSALPWFMAPAIGRKMELSARELLTGVQGSAGVSFLRDAGDTAAGIVSTLAQGKGVQYGLEEAASKTPVTAFRNIMAATLGYSVSRDHKMIKEADDFGDIMALALGLQTKRDALLRNINVVQRLNETRKNDARKKMRQIVQAAVRGGATDKISEELLRAFGGDPDAMLVGMIGLIQGANSDMGDRLLAALISGDPTKMADLQRAVLINGLAFDKEAN
jgi:hypothetical protein